MQSQHIVKTCLRPMQATKSVTVSMRTLLMRLLGINVLMWLHIWLGAELQTRLANVHILRIHGNGASN